MSAFDAASNAIEQYWKAQWVALHPSTPTRYDNVPWREPDNLAWVGFAIRESTGFQTAVNLDQHRWGGVVIVQIFQPSDNGPRIARQWADEISTIFRRKSLNFTNGVVRFQTPQFLPIGVEGGWYQSNVTVPFQRDVRVP